MEYLTIDSEVRTEFEISRSKFICSLSHCKGVDDGLEYVKKISSEFSDATHNCYALIGLPCSNEQKFSDNGEPGGTAGQPMLNVLKMNGLQGVVAVVTRYFGGIKLGAGGLVGAYSKAVADGVQASQINKMVLSSIMEIGLTYAEYKVSKNVLSDENVIVIDTEYSDMVKITFATPEENSDKVILAFSELTLGRTKPLIKEKIFIKYKR